MRLSSYCRTMAAAATTSKVDALRLLRHALSSSSSSSKQSEIHLLDKEDDTESQSESQRLSSLSAASYLSLPDPSSDDNAASTARIVLPKTTPTRFKRTPQSTASETWDLQSLLLCYWQREASIAEYAQEAVREGVELVGIMQRKIVADYLDGTNTDAAAAYIVPEAEGVNEDTSVEATLAVESGTNQAAAAAAAAATTTQEALADGAVSSAAAGASIGTTAAATATGQDAAMQARPAKKARYQVNKEDLDAYKRIVAQFEPKQLGDRSTVLRGDGVKIVNFGNVRDLIADRLKAGKEDLRRAMHPTAGAQPSAVPATTSNGSSGSSRRRRQANPIILISPSSSALITMYNVKRFLEDAVYEPSDVARASAGRIAAEDVIHVNHRRQIGVMSGDSAREDGGLSGVNKDQRGLAGEKLTRYFVVDGVDALSKFGDDAWLV